MSSLRQIVCFIGVAALCTAAPKEQWQRFNASAYTAGGETASGKQTHEGRTVAADPNILPLGTQIQVRGAGAYSGNYVVADSGPKIKGREIDIYISNDAEAKQFGKKTVFVRVIKKAESKPSAR